MSWLTKCLKYDFDVRWIAYMFNCQSKSVTIEGSLFQLDHWNRSVPYMSGLTDIPKIYFN